MFAMVWNSLVDHIPLWGWLVMIIVPIGVLLYFFSPILIPIWKVLPTPVKAVLIFITGLFVAFMGGRYRGRWNAEEEQRKRDADALQKRNEVDREIGTLSDSEAQKRLRDRWGAGS